MQEIGKRWTHPSLKALRSQWKRSVPMLIEVLAEKNSWKQKAYGWVYTNAPSLISAKLSPPLNSAQLENRRYTAAQVLSVIGAHAKPALPQLITNMRDSRARIESHAAILQIGPRDKDSPALIKLFKESQDAGTRASTVSCLSKTRPTTATFEVLKSALEDEDPFVRSQAADACSSMTNHRNIVIPLLMKRLGDPDSFALMSVARAIWRQTQKSDEIIGALRQILEAGEETKPADQTWLAKGELAIWQAVQLCGELGRNAPVLMPQLKKLRSSKEIQIRFATELALWKITGETNSIIDIGKRLLAHEDENQRIWAAKQMTHYCVEAKVDPSILDNLLKHQDLGVRVFGASALWKLKGLEEPILPILIQGVQDYYTFPSDREIREISATTLGEMVPRAKEAIPALEMALDDGEPSVEAAAKKALARIKGTSE